MDQDKESEDPEPPTIWDKPVHHKSYAKWLGDLKSNDYVIKQDNIEKTLGSLRKIWGKTLNWKPPGPGLLQIYWLKFT